MLEGVPGDENIPHDRRSSHPGGRRSGRGRGSADWRARAVPKNEKGQTLYPRYEFFREIVDVYRSSGRTAPVFNDKHLSWNWDWAKEMVETAREMGFALMAGSCLPVTTRMPAVEMPQGAEVEEIVCVGVGGPDSYDFHCLEGIQSMVERRKGGETGVVALQAIRGVAFWAALRSR